MCRLPDGSDVEEWTLFRSSQVAASGQVNVNVNVVEYQCEPDQHIRVSYFIDLNKAELERNGTVMALQEKPSGSGFIYSNGPNTIRGKGDALTLEIGRMAPIECKAKQ
ncbi:DUF333 domain-containing protein [Lampropedia puyangensis]|uniref:DUF333 domain-containing protein n=2 Tax=Lampropedia puyangensis TaxID=1330072 RepID=A0A4S8ET22_9BURK|nr:DUF333 domain-containing protein [Lampropedia puyangensis]